MNRYATLALALATVAAAAAAALLFTGSDPVFAAATIVGCGIVYIFGSADAELHRLAAQSREVRK